MNSSDESWRIRLLDSYEEQFATFNSVQWQPNPGPQQNAVDSLADELFFGGAAGGGKTYGLLGIAATAHQRSIIFRKEYVQFREIEDKARILYENYGTWDSDNRRWRLSDGRIVELGALKTDESHKKFHGNPHDFVAFDELTHFTEIEYRLLQAWNRSPIPGQRCRVIATGNPPTDLAGMWVTKRWAAWLDPSHANPAADGELRWYISYYRDGQEIEQEVLDGTPVIDPTGRIEPGTNEPAILRPRSRTFIRSWLKDNPYQNTDEYATVLDSLPEFMRRRFRDGDFTAMETDDEFQCLPSEHIDACVARWVDPDYANPPLELTALGIDPSRGGADNAVVAPIYGGIAGRLILLPGSLTRTPDLLVEKIVRNHRPGAALMIDTNNVGSAIYDALVRMGFSPIPVVAQEASKKTDKNKIYKFRNVRAAMWWQFREMIDPASGLFIAIPPDNDLIAELKAPRVQYMAGGTIQIQSKDEIRTKLHRSTDRADAVIMGYYQPIDYSVYTTAPAGYNHQYIKDRPGNEPRDDVPIMNGFSAIPFGYTRKQNQELFASLAKNPFPRLRR